jgi:uncharacterized SAM-binding protein YcdF (DUF218 family)
MAFVTRSGPRNLETGSRRSGSARGRARLIGRLAAAVAITGVAAGAVWLAKGYADFQSAIVTAEPRQPPRADGIVVLTGGAQRMHDGLALLADGRGKRLLISGVHEKTGRDEIARLTGVRRQSLDCCVDLGRSARNTIGNALEARRWAKANGFKSLLVVTSNYHMPRTLEEFAHVLDGVTVSGYSVVSDHTDGDSLSTRLLLSEYAKVVVSRLRRAVEDDPEHSRLPVLVGRQKPLGHLPIETSSGS